MNAKTIAGVTLGVAGSAVGGLMPLTSLYKSGQEDRGVFSSTGHFIGATVAGSAIGVASNIGGMALMGNADNIAQTIAKFTIR